MRVSVIALLFVIASASEFYDDPPGTKYYIQNSKTKKYLFMGREKGLPNEKVLAQYAYIWNFPNIIPPYDAKDSQFYISPNNAIGPYYQIQNVGCACTLFGSEYTVSPVLNNSVNIVMGWESGEHNNTPEALWNIRHFNDNLYILNVQYGAYMYANDDIASPTLVDRNKRYAVLMPSDTAGRVAGTEWLLIAVDEGQGFVARSGDQALETVVADEEKDGENKDGHGARVGGEYGGGEGGQDQNGEGVEGGDEGGKGEEGKDGEERVKNEKVAKEKENVREEKVDVKVEGEKETGKGNYELVENNKSLKKDPPDAEGKLNERKMKGEKVVEDKIVTQIVGVEIGDEKKVAPTEKNASVSEKKVEGKVEREKVKLDQGDLEKDEVEGNQGEQIKEKKDELGQKDVAVKDKEEQVATEEDKQRTDKPLGTEKMVAVEKYEEMKEIGEKVDHKKVEGERNDFAGKYTTVTVEQDGKVKEQGTKLEGEGGGGGDKAKPVEKDLTEIFEKDAEDRVEGGNKEQKDVKEEKEEPLGKPFERNYGEKVENEKMEQRKVEEKEKPV